MIFAALELLEAVLKQSVKNSPAVLTLGQRCISYVGSMMGRLCKHRVPGVSRLMTSLRCVVIAVLEELTPTECICAQWLGVHGFDCSTSSFLCCAVLWTAYNRRHMPTPLSCRCLSALVPIALQSSWPDVVAAFLVPTFPVGGRIPRDPDGTDQGAEGQEDQGPDQEFANIADEAGTADTRPAPLENGCNACYMNAAFQCLWACPAARDVLQRAYENAPTTAKQSLTMLARKARDSRKPLSPAAAKDVLLGDAFQQAMQQDPPRHRSERLELLLNVYHYARGTQQQDAQDFLSAMLNDEEGIDAKKHGQTSVVNAVGALFTGLWEPGFICSHGHEQKHFNDKGLVAGREPFKVVAIEIQTYDGLPLTTLREAWEQFRQAEGMEKSFAYVCWTCGCRKPPRKIMHVVSAPKILCLHLKRWTVCQKTQRGQLLKHPVDFELTAFFF